MNGINEGCDEVSQAIEVGTAGRERSTRRPGTRTIVATTGERDSWRLSRVGLTLDDAIAEELGDYLAGRARHEARGGDRDAYAAGQPDVSLWEGERCLAVIRPRSGGDPEILRFDR